RILGCPGRKTMARCSQAGSGSKVSGSSAIACARSSSVRASTRVQSVWPSPPCPKDVLVILPLIAPRSPCTNQLPGRTAPGEHDGNNPSVEYAIGDIALFSMFLLLGGNLQDLALPDFLGIHEINPVLAEVV